MDQGMGKSTMPSPSFSASPRILMLLFLQVLLFSVLRICADDDVTKDGFRANSLTLNEAEELEDLINIEVGNTIEDRFNIYLPGIAVQRGLTLTNGRQFIVRVMVWIGATCNLGLGSEGAYPPGILPALWVEDTFSNYLFRNTIELMQDGYASGFASYRNVSMDYWEVPLGTQLPPDNSQERYDGLFQIEGTSRNSTKSLGTAYLRINHSEPLPEFRNSSTKTTPPFRHVPVNNNSTVLLGWENQISLKQRPSMVRGVSKVTGYWPADTIGNCEFYSTGMISQSYYDWDYWWVNVLQANEYIQSPSGRFYLLNQMDCNLVLYDRDQNGYYSGGQKIMGPYGELPIWASGSYGSVNCKTALYMQGTLAQVTTSYNTVAVKWRTTNTACYIPDGYTNCWSDAYLQVQDDGNVVMYLLDEQAEYYVVNWKSDTQLCQGACPRIS